MGNKTEKTLLIMDNLSSTWMMEVDANATLQPQPDSYYFYKTEQLTFLWIMFTMIVMGNSAVLVALLLSKNKKSRMNFFITHLAVADLSVGLISVLTDIIWKMTVSWLAGNVLCKLIRYLQVTVTYSSTYVLVALSIDRYDAITHPMKFSGSWRRAHVLVIVAWFLSAIFSIPILILYEEALIDGQFQCWIDLGEKWKWQLYLTLVTVSLFLIPTLIISACYAIIVITIWSKGKTLTGQPNSTKTKHSKDRVDMDSKRASSRGIIPKAKIKTVKMTFVIVFVFILCWSPYFIYDLLQVFGQLPTTPTQNAIATFMQSLAPLNSAANPIIYCLFSTHICRNLRKIPLMNWLAEHVCCCFPSLRQPLRQATINRGSDYTTMSESLSRSSRRSSSSLLRNASIARNQQLRCSNVIKKHVTISSSDNNSADPTLNSNV